MKYFVCTLNNIQIGIMAHKTEKIIQSIHTMNCAFETQTTNNGELEIFVSLPALFLLKDTITPHTVVLKTCAISSLDQKVKIFLLTTRIENEVEIPEESIHPLPLALADLYGYSKGIYFTNEAAENMILILNIEKFFEKLP